MDVPYWQGQASWASVLDFSPLVSCPLSLSMWVVWLTSGDLALDFLCSVPWRIAEHRFIPSRSRSVCHQLRRAGYHSVWAPACQDRVAGCHAGCWGGWSGWCFSFLSHHLSLLSFKEFFRLGPCLKKLLFLLGKEEVVHLFVVYGYQGAEEDADQLQLTDKLLQAVLAEAQVVCIGQPMLIAGDLNADPAVIPCLAEGVSAGRYVDLALGLFSGETWSYS